MNEFLKMDIFFFVTTLMVIVLGAMAGYLIYRIHRILKHVEHISHQAALESDAIRADLAEMRRDVREGKGRLKSLFSFVEKFTKRRPRKTTP